MLANAIGAEFRRFEQREFQGQPANVVVATRTYDTDAEDLWDAVTSPERIPRWFLPIEGDLKPSGRYQLQGNAGGTITRCEPPRGFDITWEFGGGTSWVTVRIEPQGKRAKLTLEHISHASVLDEHWKQFGPAAVGVGWELGLLGLGMHIASGGTPIDPQAVNEWSSAADGKAFMRASARAWADAHASAGEDPATALAMAARTAAFYTGEECTL